MKPSPPAEPRTELELDAMRNALKAAAWRERARWLGEFTWRLAVLAPLAEADLGFLRGVLEEWGIHPESAPSKAE